jgi:predicted phage tail protein
MKKSIAKTVIGALLICASIYYFVGIAFNASLPSLFWAELAALGIGIWMVVTGIKAIRQTRA